MNVELLRKVQAHILEEPKRIRMDSWFTEKDAPQSLRGRITPTGYQIPDCGTIACIAGWAAVLSKQKLSYIIDGGLDLSRAEGDRLFLQDAWPSEFQDRLNDTRAQTPEYAQVVSDRIDHFIATNGEE